MTTPDLTASDADDPRKSICVWCDINIHDECLYLTRPTSCGCACDWLQADMTANFPSLQVDEPH